jgi:peptidoglycan-N-acetylglucosamine deacetylase
MKHQMLTSLGKLIFPEAVWKMDALEKKVYLTFDDGPHPQITDEVLSILKDYNAKATFFCLGKNVKQAPDVYSRILAEGHSVGNHTYNHLKGWRTGFTDYIEDVEKTRMLIASKIFRPPYGKFTRAQYYFLKQQYKIIMWDILSYDYDKTKSPEYCLQHCISRIKPGSIIVLHDSEKAYNNMRFVLPRLLEAIAEKNLVTEKINSDTV